MTRRPRRPTKRPGRRRHRDIACRTGVRCHRTVDQHRCRIRRPRAAPPESLHRLDESSCAEPCRPECRRIGEPAPVGDHRVEEPMSQCRSARRRIDIGAGRSPAEIVDDLRSAAERFSAAVTAVPDEAWGGRFGWERRRRPDDPRPPGALGAAEGTGAASRRPRCRLQPQDWAPWFVDRALAETLRRFGRRDDVPELTLVINGATERFGSGGATMVTGSARSMLGWLTGRSGRRVAGRPSRPASPCHPGDEHLQRQGRARRSARRP